MSKSKPPKGWNYRKISEIPDHSLHIEVIADYGGSHTTDHAFSEVRNHFLRFDTKNKIRMITDHPVYAFSTIETGFWIAQEALHSEHKNLVIFSNTAPRGDVAWKGERKQPFVCAILRNGIPVFAVNAGYNLSFIREHVTGIWKVRVPNWGTQFRSRDQYPEATIDILYGRYSRIGQEVNPKEIKPFPKFSLASIDGYGNLKTTIRERDLPEKVRKARRLRITLNGRSHFVYNTLAKGTKGKARDLCLVSGSSGGKGKNFLEIVRLMGRAADDYGITGPSDDLGPIIIEAV